MKTQKPLLAGFVIGLFIALTPACGTGGTCTPANCRTGCCDSKGQCQSGASANACGQLGGACATCQLGTACNLGTCMASGFGGGTQGGGTGAGTAGGGTTGGGTTGGGTTGGGTTGGGTPGGGTTGGGTTGGGTTGGGTTGGGTTGGGTTGGGTTGGGNGCDGCIASGTTTCINLANSGTNSFCGRNGVTCATCGTNQTCTNYQCVGGTGGGGGTTGGGGGTTGGGGGTGVTIGMTCTTNSQCTGLGSGAKCKLQTTPFGGNAPTPYPSGFCTVPCSGIGSCPGGAVCAGGVSSYPYLFNDVDQFCTKPCTASAQCGTGLVCGPASTLFTQSQPTGCFIAPSSTFFTGGGFPTKAGNPCTTDTDCANPPDPALASCLTNTAFTGGYCLASSDFAPADTWCDTAGKTEVGFPLSDGGAEFYCLGTCSPAGTVGNSRNGYTCFRKSAATPNIGVQWPKCTTNTDCQGLIFADGGTTVCNPTSGFCCSTTTSTTSCVIDFN